jgi:hypothetical protein
MFSKSIFTAAALGAVGLAGLGAAFWNEPSLAQGQQPPAEAPNPAETAKAAAAAARQTVMNAKKILLAVHNYNDRNGFFPPPAITDDAGRPLLSWRVALLPYLDQNELYQQFRLDEPWDGPHNKALIDKMPDVFESPEAPASKGRTRFRGFAGWATIFDLNPPERGEQGEAPRRGVRPSEIYDGTSNTVFLALARDAAPWTMPGELPFVAGHELPALDESDPKGWLLGLCDGSVHRLPKDRRSLLPFLITRHGGEVIGTDWYKPEATSAPAPTTPPLLPTAPAPAPATPPATASPSVEQRLQRLEEKVDRLLEKLDAIKP